MNVVQQQNKAFLEKSLLDLCKRINKKIEKLNYLIIKPNEEEYIEIIFKKPEKDIINRKINITNKSLKAITINVLLSI